MITSPNNDLLTVNYKQSTAFNACTGNDETRTFKWLWYVRYSDFYFVNFHTNTVQVKMWNLDKRRTKTNLIGRHLNITFLNMSTRVSCFAIGYVALCHILSWELHAITNAKQRHYTHMWVFFGLRFVFMYSAWNPSLKRPMNLRFSKHNPVTLMLCVMNCLCTAMTRQQVHRY